MKKNFLSGKISVLISSISIFCVILLCNGFAVNAADNNEHKTKTVLTVINEETGETEEYVYEDASSVTATKNSNGETVITEDINILPPDSNTDIKPRIDTSKSDSAYGYKLHVRLTYTDDGTWACLQEVYARFEKVSGSYNVSNGSVDYGQVLGTNSRRATSNMLGVGTEFGTGFPKGKYGKGHYLGATLSGKIGSYNVSLNHNVYL